MSDRVGSIGKQSASRVKVCKGIQMSDEYSAEFCGCFLWLQLHKKASLYLMQTETVSVNSGLIWAESCITGHGLVNVPVKDN